MALSDLALVAPSAKYPFDPFEKWLNEPDDVSFYLIDQDEREVGVRIVLLQVEVA